MQREIKFRGYSDLHHCWIYGDLIQCRVIPEILDSNRNQYEIDASTIGQFTGLYDKNGKEIYEHDVLKGIFNIKTGEERRRYGRKYSTYDKYSDREIISVVQYVGCCFRAISDFKEYYKTHFYSGMGYTQSERKANEWTDTYTGFNKMLNEINQKVEVVSNIFDNP